MSIRRKLLILFLALAAGGYLLLITAFNEAFHIKRTCPDARVYAGHRFTNVLSLWDLFPAPIDYLSPIDYADIRIDAASEPVDLGELLQFRVGHIQIMNSKVANYGALLNYGSLSPAPSIIIINSTFVGASPEEMLSLEKNKKTIISTSKEYYLFGGV